MWSNSPAATAAICRSAQGMRRGSHDNPPVEPAAEGMPEMAAIRRHLRADLGDPDPHPRDPPPPATPIDGVLREIRAGGSKREALRSMQELLLPLLGLLLIATLLALFA
jgi:hypothetical protein